MLAGLTSVPPSPPPSPSSSLSLLLSFSLFRQRQLKCLLRSSSSALLSPPLHHLSFLTTRGNHAVFFYLISLSSRCVSCWVDGSQLALQKAFLRSHHSIILGNRGKGNLTDFSIHLSLCLYIFGNSLHQSVKIELRQPANRQEVINGQVWTFSTAEREVMLILARR